MRKFYQWSEVAMLIEETTLPGVLRLTPRRFGDHRGFFAETYNIDTMAAAGIDTVFVQDNQSLSEQAGTLRGLHFQAPPHAQAKLVRCGRGALFDVAVDLRRGSPTYGHWLGETLSFENGVQLLIPAGFAHGFVTLQQETEIIYKCSDLYAPEAEGALKWDDPDLAIDWPLDGRAPVISDKDARAPALRDFDSPFVWDGAGT
jgi:dTDP-4-dehydrorhamnose 3,5-epimerase